MNISIFQISAFLFVASGISFLLSINLFILGYLPFKYYLINFIMVIISILTMYFTVPDNQKTIYDFQNATHRTKQK